MKSAIYTALLAILFLSSCKPSYDVIALEEKTFAHKEIAILPFEVYTYGTEAKETEPEILEELEVGESLLFQRSFCERVSNEDGLNKNALMVGVQDHKTTNNILEENGVSTKESWKIDPAELANMLDVDAVLMARVEKEQFFSDGKSASLNIANILLSLFLDSQLGDFDAKNKAVFGDYSLVDRNGEVLWSSSYTDAANWTRQADELVDRFNRRLIRRFPYRVR